MCLLLIHKVTSQQLRPKPPQEPESISLDVTELVLTEGETHTFAATVLPTDAVDKTVNYASNATSIATVTPKQGKVTAVAEGTAVITATTVNGKQVEVNVTVNKAEGGG